MAISTSLEDLLTKPSLDDIVDILLTYLSTNGFPVTDWTTDGTERLRIKAFATGLLDLASAYIPTVTSGGFVDLAQGKWLQLLADQRFNIQFFPATTTQGIISLTNNSATTYNFQQGELIIVFPTGNRYISNGKDGYGVQIVGDISIPPGVTRLTVESEYANNSKAIPPLNYNDISGSAPITISQPSLPGVVITNPTVPYSAIELIANVISGSSSGTITLTPSNPSLLNVYEFSINILTTGEIGGSATWNYSRNNVVQVGIISDDTYTDPTTNITITLNNNTPTSFVAGDRFIFSSPSSWISHQGVDEESDNSLKQRCLDRLPSLNTIGSIQYYELLARQANDQVSQVSVSLDGYVNDQVNVIVASHGAVIPVPGLAEIQRYMSARAPITDLVVVQSPIQYDVDFTGSIIFDPLQTTSETLQGQVEAILETYVANIPINGTIVYYEVIRLILDQLGSTDVSLIQVNSGSSNIILGTQLEPFQLAVITSFGFQYQVNAANGFII